MKINFKEVAEGWEAYLSRSDVTEKIAKERAKICAVCPHLKKGKLLQFIKDDFKEVQGCYCGICKCPTSAKIRSLSSECSDNPKRWESLEKK